MTKTWLIRREVLPNATAPLIAEFGLRFCFVFLTISSLSFLGLGLCLVGVGWFYQHKVLPAARRQAQPDAE